MSNAEKASEAVVNEPFKYAPAKVEEVKPPEYRGRLWLSFACAVCAPFMLKQRGFELVLPALGFVLALSAFLRASKPGGSVVGPFIGFAANIAATYYVTEHLSKLRAEHAGSVLLFFFCVCWFGMWILGFLFGGASRLSGDRGRPSDGGPDY